MDCYIISYFGDSVATRHTRQALHYQQVCCLLKTPGVENIHILAQGYTDHTRITLNKDYLTLDHPRIHYHYSEQCSPAQARNKLIKVFESTGKSWGLFADNDAAIDPRFHGENIVNVIEHNEAWLTQNVDVLVPMSPRHQPFNSYIEQEYNKGNLATHTPIRRVNYCKTTLFFLKNQQAVNKENILFDEELTELEDFEYIGRVLSRGGVIYQLQAVVMSDLGLNEQHSTLFENKERVARFDEIKQRIYKRYFPRGVWQGSKTQFKWATLGDNKNKQTEYKLPLQGVEGSVLYTQDNLFHTLFEEI